MKRLICLMGAVLGAAGVSQVPEYAQQYAQRLGGAIDELGAVIERFDADAAASGLTREEGIARYSLSPDPFLVDRGVSIQAVFARYEQLRAQRSALANASAVERVSAMTRYFDTDVGAATLEDFKPALPITTEGLAHAAVGLGLGYGMVWSLWTAVAAPFRWRRRRTRIRLHQ